MPPRARCKDDETIYNVIKDYADLFPRVSYRTELDKGTVKHAAIEANTKLLVGIRSAIPHALAQVPCVAALTRLASEREDEWNLGPERDAWAFTRAKRLRCMLRDVQQNVLKWQARSQAVAGQAPDWLSPFLDAASAAQVRTPDDYDFGWDDDEQARLNPNDRASHAHKCSKYLG